jgi:hypothetical protein
VHTFVVAEDDIPPNIGRFGVDWEQYLQDGGRTAGQGWWVHKPPGRIALVGSGTCGPFCNIAKSVALYLAEHFGPALDQLAVVDVGAGVGSFAACLSSMHGVGTTMSVSPWEQEEDEHGGQEAGQTSIATQRGVPLLIDYASSDRQLPLQAGSVHAVFSCYSAGGTLKSHNWFWYEVSRLLKPGGFLILEGHLKSHTRLPIPKNITQFCMAPAPAPKGFENRWFTGGKWMRYQGQLRAYRRLSVQECDLDATRVADAAPLALAADALPLADAAIVSDALPLSLTGVIDGTLDPLPLPLALRVAPLAVTTADALARSVPVGEPDRVADGDLDTRPDRLADAAAVADLDSPPVLVALRVPPALRDALLDPLPDPLADGDRLARGDCDGDGVADPLLVALPDRAGD